MEFCGSTTLEAHFRKPENSSTPQIRDKFRQIVRAVVFLHQHGIYHRDITIKNVLVTAKDRVKIIDFGLAVDNDEPRSDCAGTLAYLCPQMLAKQKHRPSSADIWCLGVLLYAVYFNKHPFGGMAIDYQIRERMTQETRQSKRSYIYLLLRTDYLLTYWSLYFKKSSLSDRL